jgi:hypothetical protein
MEIRFRGDMTVELVKPPASDADVIWAARVSTKFAQREIELVVAAMERQWAAIMPLTHAAFESNGRVAP